MKRCYVPRNFSPASLRIVQQAEQICAEYAADGYDLTLRQLYYQFVARGLIPNKQTEYKRLGSIVNDARLAGLIDWSFIVDRTRNLSDLAHWDDPAEIIEAVSHQFRLAKWDRQPRRVEVWIEKEALAGVVERICRQLDVPFFACRGYVSQSEQWSAAQRIGGHMRRGQSVTVLHLGDHDPSGIDMTRDNRERLMTFLTEDLEGTDHLDRLAYEDAFTVERIALNMDQVRQYDPPPNPAKLTDSRIEGYLDAYGDESWELDALPPDVLSRLIEAQVEALRDEALWNEDVGLEDEHRRLLASASQRWPEIVDFLGTGH